MSMTASAVLRLQLGMTAISAERTPQPAAPEADAHLEALVRGEADALARLYREHHEPVRALVRRFLADPSVVEDVLHDVFVAAPSAFCSYRGEGSVRSYLFALAVRTVQHHARSARRRRGWLERFRLDPGVARVATPTPEASVGRTELAKRLQSALDSLSFEHRAAVVLCELQELTSPEAARILDVPEATVRTRLHHAKRRLREALEDLHE